MKVSELVHREKCGYSLIKCIVTLAVLLFVGVAKATTYYSKTTAGLSPAVLANWGTNTDGTGTAPTNFTTASDIFIMQSSMTNLAAWTVSGAGSEVRIVSGAVWTFGSFNASVMNVTLNSGGTITMGIGRTLTVNGNWTNNGGTFNTSTGTVIFGTGGNITGSSATTFYRITINTTAATDVVSVTKSPVTVSAPASSVTITQGIFKVGTGNQINFSSVTTAAIAVASTGNFANSANGYTDADGGTMNFASTSGSAVTISGTGTPVFYNVASSGDGNWKFTITSTGSPRINGTFYITHNLFQCTTSATQYPTWGSSSTLSINNIGNSYTPGSSTHREWMIMSGGTIGTTPGYPNNVVLMNLGNATDPNVILSADTKINGSLTIGDASSGYTVSLNNAAVSFTCTDLLITSTSSLKAPPSGYNLTVNGNWTNNGTYIHNSGNVILAGSSSQTIGGTASTTFYNVTTNNSAGVTLNTSVGVDGTLTMTQGVITSTVTYLLTINNTATSAINATGSSTNMINGPVKWSILSSGTNVYSFPVGAGTTYLPFILSSVNTTVGNTVTIQAFSSGSGGSALSLSTTEYWSMSSTATLGTAGSTVSITRPTAISPFSVIGMSNTTVSGVYSSIAGTAGTYGVTGSNNIGTVSPWYFAFASPVPVITLDHTGITQTSASNVAQGSTDNIVSNFRVAVTTVNATLNSISFTVGGNFVAGDISNFKLYTSSSNSFPGGAALSNVTATSYVGGVSTVTFSSLTQSCPIGSAYFWITADVASGATLTKTIIVPATPTCTFASGNVTNSIAIGGTKTIVAPTPVVLLDHTGITQVSAGTVIQGTNNNIVSNFRVNVTAANATLSSLSFTIGGNFVAGDISNFKLYTSASSVFPGGAALSTVVAMAYIGGTSSVAFTSLSQSCSIGNTYFWITADIASGATVSKTIIVPATPTVTFSAATITNNIVIGGTQTITAPTPIVVLDQTGITQVTSGNITQGSTNNIVSNFRVNVTASNATLNSLSFTGLGNFAVGDILNYKLYTSTSSVFPGGAALSTVTATTYTGTTTVTFSSLSQSCIVGTDRYFWITVDVGTGAAAIGKTVQVPAGGGAPNVALSFTSATVTNNIAVAGVKTIIAGTPLITLDHTGITQTSASAILLSSTDNILSNFRANVTTADATLNTISFTVGGNFVAGDITNIKLYTSTTNIFPGGAALSTVVASGFNGGSSAVTFSSLNQSCVAGTDRYFWITADVASGAVVTKTISIPATPTCSFAIGTVTNSITAGGTKTIAAQNDYYNTGNVAGNVLSNWTTNPTGGAGLAPASFTAGDVFHIRAGTTVTTSANWTISGTGSKLEINGTLTLSNTLSISGYFTNKGTFNHGNQTVTFGTGGIIDGTNATTFYNITINTTNATDVVYLNYSGTTKIGVAGGSVGVLTFTKGIFNIGSSNILEFISTQTGPGIVNNGGNFATTGTNGSDGGTILVDASGGGHWSVGGTTATTFYNLKFAANATLDYASAGTPSFTVNGTFTIPNNNWAWGSNPKSPIYGSAATLYYNRGGIGYTPSYEWIAMASGTIGTTVGYPNNVVLVNNGTSQNNGTGFGPTGTWAINGVFALGDGTINGSATLQSMTTFTCGGIKIDNNSTLKHGTENFYVKGNWTQQGTTTGVFTVVSGTVPVTFSGNGTSVSPQTINCTGSVTSISTINSIAIANATYVKLNCPVILQTTGALTLTSGILETSATNILSITNTATTGIGGSGSSTTYINGPVKWTIANSTTNKYTFPVGKSTVYLPFEITPANAQANNVITLEAFNSNCGGTPDNVTINAISNTEYWSLSSTLSFTAATSVVSAARISGVDSFNVLAKCATLAGTYTGIGGGVATVGGITGIANATGTSTYLVFAHGPLSINLVSISYPSCSVGSTGSVTVSGSGGSPSYTYNINGGSYTSSGTFTGLAAATYTISVKDQLGNTASISVVMNSLIVTSDTGTCNGNSIQLLATGATALSYNWSPSTGLSSTTIANPIASPTSTTTYTVTATILDSANNLITNGGFESGNTSFLSDYRYNIYSATFGGYTSSTNPTEAANGNGIWGQGFAGSSHSGVYLITGQATNLCVGLQSFTPRTGSYMFVTDGPFGSTTYKDTIAWGQNVTVTPNTDYVFSFWIRNAYNSTSNVASIRTKINGTSLTGTSSNPYSASSSTWTQLTYSWNSGASTSAAIRIYDETSSDVSNDFALDDITFYGTCQSSKSVTVTITPTPTLNVVAQPLQACQGAPATISLSGLTASSTFTVNYTINNVAQTAATNVTSDASGNASFTTTNLSLTNNGQVLQISSIRNTTGNSNCTQTFTGKSVTLSVNTYVTWLGSTSTAWNTASNWCGGVPIATSNVLIPDYGGAGTYPIISSGVSGLCNNIVISSNATVVINNGGTLTVRGTYTSNGTLQNDGDITFNSSTIGQSFPGATGTVSSMKNITINNTSGLGMTFNNNFSISGVLSPISGVINVNNAIVSLLSSSTSTAQVSAVGVSSGFTYTGSGKFSVERYLPMDVSGNYVSRRWRLMGVPVSTTAAPTINEAWQEGAVPFTITAGTSGTASIYDPNPGYGTRITNGLSNTANGFDASTTASPSIYYWNGSVWSTPSSTGYTITNQNAYMLFVRGNRSVQITNQYQTTSGGALLRVKGQLNVGQKTVAVPTGYSMISNPYASAINMRNVNYNGTGSTNNYILWDPKLLGSKNVGGWVTFSWSGSAYTQSYDFVPYSSSGVSTFPTSGVLESGTAFMLNNTSGSATSIVFNEASKVSGSSTIGIASRPITGDTYGKMYVNLLYRDALDSAILADGVLTGYGNTFSNDIDEMDIPKAQLFQTREKIGLLRAQNSLAIERRKSIINADTIFLQMYKLDYNYKYQLECIALDFDPQLIAFLEDRYLNTLTQIGTSGTSKYNFATNADPSSLSTDRFRIVFRMLEGAPLPIRFIDINAKKLSESASMVQWTVSDPIQEGYQYEIQRSYDGVSYFTIGKQSPRDITNQMYRYIDSTAFVNAPSVVYYRIKSVSNSGNIIYSQTAKITGGNGTQMFSSMLVWPNPIKQRSIHLFCSKIQTGLYHFDISNTAGQVIQKGAFVLNTSQPNSNVAIDLSKNTAKGCYQLRIVRGSKQIMCAKIFVDE